MRLDRHREMIMRQRRPPHHRHPMVRHKELHIVTKK